MGATELARVGEFMGVEAIQQAGAVWGFGLSP